MKLCNNVLVTYFGELSGKFDLNFPFTLMGKYKFKNFKNNENFRACYLLICMHLVSRI